MRTLIKAILRFFKYNKLSFIGLFMLVLFSSSIFTALNNTTINLNRSYLKISNEGNLHDFVINENYKYGNGIYTLNIPSNGSNQQIDGTLDVKKITNYGSSFDVELELNTKLITNVSSSFLWTNAYQKIYEEYSKQPLVYEEFKKFLSFTTTITLSNSVTNIDINNWYLNQEFIDSINLIIDSKKQELDAYVKKNYKEIYKKNLKEKFNIELRDFSSINVQNTKQKIFYKVIESNPGFSIDKLVIYEGNNLSNSNKNFNKFNEVYSANETTKIQLFRELVGYLNKAKWSSGSTNHNNFYELLDYTNKNINYNPYTNKNLDQVVMDVKVKKQSSIFKNIIDSGGVYSNGFTLKFSYRDSGIIPVIGEIEDFTSYEAIISPEYLKKFNKKPIDINLWNSHTNDSQTEFENWLNNDVPIENKIYVDNQVFIILGTGISPDFMYPILSFENVVPNRDKEQLIYTTSTGYAKIEDAFRANEQEKFIVGKFLNREINFDFYINQINEFNKGYMAWPDNIKSTYSFDDISNTVTPTALRMQFIPNTVLAITIVSAFLTTFIVILSIFISTIVIQRFIQINRNNLGIMQANGYKKREIITGVCALISIPVGLATIIGYTIGFLIQDQIINLLGNFWTLPTTLEPFSLLVLLPLLFVAIGGFVLLTIVFTIWSLRGETSEFMKDESKYKSSKISEIIKKPFTKFNIMTRFRAAVAFSSIWRIILLSVMSAGLMMSLTFSFDVIGTFNNSLSKTFEPRKYSYSIELFTPTLQSGQYYTTPSNNQGLTMDKNVYFDVDGPDRNLIKYYDENWIANDYTNSSAYGKYLKPGTNYNDVFFNFVKENGNIQLVSQEDSSKQDNSPTYLKNLTTIKAFTNSNLGVGALSTNPWYLAEQLMPPNNVAYINQTYYDIFSLSTKMNNPTSDLINIGIKSNVSSSTDEIINGTRYERKTYYEYIKKYSIAYAVKKDANTTQEPSIPGINQSSIKVISDLELKNLNSVFYNYTDSNELYDYYFEFDESKITPSFLGIKTSFDINFLCLLYSIYTNNQLKDYTYGINYHKLVVDNESNQNSPYSYLKFNIETINGDQVDIAEELTAKGLLGSKKYPENRILIKNKSNENLANKLWNTDIQIVNNQKVYPIVINEFASEKLGIGVGDTLKIRINNSADRYSRIHFKKENPSYLFKVIDIATTYYGNEFYVSQYDANEVLGLTINNIKPTVPKTANDIKEQISWENVEYDWSNSYIFKNNVIDNQNKPLLLREDFDPTRSGYNAMFSFSNTELREITSGMSLYSPIGIYPATDRITSSNLLIKKLFSDKPENMKFLIETTGFYDLVYKTASGTIDWNATSSNYISIIDEISTVFGTSASFAIISNVESKDSSLNVINTISSTATKIQNIVLMVIIFISCIIVIIISSIIINDSIKLAAILKCLGLANKNNALSFLSVYFPVFFLGLIISIPFSMLLSVIYVKIILVYSGILLVVKPIWWHFVLSAIGVMIVFALSYRVAWRNISKMNLSESIK